MSDEETKRPAWPKDRLEMAMTTDMPLTRDFFEPMKDVPAVEVWKTLSPSFRGAALQILREMLRWRETVFRRAVLRARSTDEQVLLNRGLIVDLAFETALRILMEAAGVRELPAEVEPEAERYIRAWAHHPVGDKEYGTSADTVVSQIRMEVQIDPKKEGSDTESIPDSEEENDHGK